MISFLLFSFSCSSGNGRADGDAGDGDTDAVDFPDPEGSDEIDDGSDTEPVPCVEDRDCNDGNPCNGSEYCDPLSGVCAAGVTVEDGRICSLDPRRICLSGLCTASLCGDGFLDGAGGEFCEPPGAGECDEECLLICEGDPDCFDDANPCNGEETCSLDTSRCSRRNRPLDGTICNPDPRSICLGGSCTQSLCGDGFVDSGGEEYCEPPYEGSCDRTCGLVCGGDPDCADDGDVCNGQEYCDLDTTRCSRRDIPAAGTPCDDGNPYTSSDECDGTGLCVGGGGCGFASISAGSALTCGLLDTGRALCWGANLYGQLGDGTTTNRSTPTPVTGLSSGVAAIAAGTYHTCAVLDTREALCWGINQYGQLGDGTTEERTGPTMVTGLSSGVAVISAGYLHTCAVLETGQALCWGHNNMGQVGDGTLDTKTVPTPVTGLSTGVAALSAGLNFTCALLDSGQVWCWGTNLYGQLGDGTTENKTTPTEVTGLPSGAMAIAAASDHACAALVTGRVLCWGRNNYGQLGDGTTTDKTTPSEVAGLSSGVAMISARGSHTCALSDTGQALCWGFNGSGQLGDGTTIYKMTPTEVTGLPSGIASISAGGGHTCALLDVGQPLCWGDNFHGQLGEGSTTAKLTPMPVLCDF